MKLLLFILLTSWNTLAYGMDLNDVSILMDLPKASETLNFLPGGKDSGMKGKLLIQDLHKKMEPIVTGSMDMPKNEYEALRVIGVRIDPCFKYVYSEKCFPQLRLVWQPLKQEKTGFSTFDAGLHTFYELSASEFTSLVNELKNLKVRMNKLGASTAGKPLSIHPAFLNFRTRSLFASEIKQIILKFAGNKNLSRVTFMKLFTPNIWWVFGGFEIKNGEALVMKIPRHSRPEEVQNFFNDDFNEPMSIKGSIVPELERSVVENNLTQLLHGYTSTFTSAANKPMIKNAIEVLDKVENPLLFTPETMDCVHCHVATATRAWVNHYDKAFYQRNKHTPYKYRGLNLSNVSQSLNNPKSMRVFGYFGDKTAISQRVINETAEVLKSLKI